MEPADPLVRTRRADYYDPMLSYRHAFHAGNHADVLKHLVLRHCLEYLGKKDRPYIYIDTHAGAGSYLLEKGYAALNREWEMGIGRLSREDGMPEELRRYLDILERFAEEAGAPRYPGSPALARKLLRPSDKAALFELHGTDYELLREECSEDRRCKVLKEDGLRALAGLLPPIQRRACILIDPPYEMKGDYEEVPRVLGEALRRFPQGVYLVWYPLLNRSEARDLGERILSLHRGNACIAELALRPAPDSERGMYGSGLALLNPPWTLKAALGVCLPYLASSLGSDTSSFKFLWRNATP